MQGKVGGEGCEDSGMKDCQASFSNFGRQRCRKSVVRRSDGALDGPYAVSGKRIWVAKERRSRADGDE